jgi:hypothetical protein
MVNEWRLYRCPITGCGAFPFWVRPSSRVSNSWSVGFVDSQLRTTYGPVPLCPCCGDELERLMHSEPAIPVLRVALRSPRNSSETVRHSADRRQAS